MAIHFNTEFHLEISKITHAREKSKVLAKASKLQEYLDTRTNDRKAIGVFFAPVESEKYLTETNLMFIPIETVFEQLTKYSDYKEMLKTMIGITEPQEENLKDEKVGKALNTAKKIENLVSKSNKDILEYGSLRQVLDSYSDEWRRNTPEQRVQVFQHLFNESKITVDEFTTAIQEDAYYYDSINKPHIKEKISESLLETIKNIVNDYTLIKK